jgi:integrase/recombinase XerD
MYEQRASDILRNLERDNIPFDFETFDAEMFSTASATAQQAPNLADYTRQIADQLALEKRHGNCLLYRNLAHLFDIYKPNTRLADINGAWLTRFEHYQRAERGMKPGGISANMRTLRAVCNRAIKAGVMRQDWYPFRAYTIGHLNQPTPKRAIPLHDLNRIQEADLAGDRNETFARDLFFFSLYARGMNLVDIAHLRPENIRAGRIEYIRRKTHQPYSVALNDQTAAIIQRYVGQYYCFPILSEFHDTPKRQQERIHRVMVDVNRALRAIAFRVGIPGASGISFYVARHSYATALKERGVSTEVISEALGHSNLKTTEIYLKQFDRSIIDAADTLLL